MSPTLNNNNNMMLTAENIPRGADEDDAFGVGWAVHGQLNWLSPWLSRHPFSQYSPSTWLMYGGECYPVPAKEFWFVYYFFPQNPTL